MTTRALEDSEIKATFDHVDGIHAKRNETLLITGIGLALRASELVGLKVSDVYCGRERCTRGVSASTNLPHAFIRQVKSYVTIRPETAKFGKERTIRIGEGLQNTIDDFIEWKAENNESVGGESPLFVSQKSGHLTRQAYVCALYSSTLLLIDALTSTRHKHR